MYEEAAMRAMRALWHYKSNIGLVGNHVDVSNGKWTATDAGIGTVIQKSKIQFRKISYQATFIFSIFFWHDRTEN